ncbi:MAG: GreA/GreB family elongation factor [Candidatus Sumerlaeia bacterium]|nr:GreA/GreB family elongation factor [Candidatus Sumerlaeia bacterium]
MQEVEQELRDQIKDLIRARKFGDLETLWLTIIEEPARSLGFHQSVIRYLFNRKETDRLAELYSVLITQRAEQGNIQQARAVAALILEQDPTAEFLRPVLINLVKITYADRDPERVAEFLRLSGLDGETPNLRQALDRLEDLFGASRGQVFRHTQWGLGVVREFDARDGVAIIDFQRKHGQRMTMEGLKNFLRRIPADHLLARIATVPDAVKTEAFEDPAAIVRHALKSSGGKMKAADLKKLLTDQLLTEAEYKRWWGKAKDECRTDPYVDQSGTGANQVLVLRAEPRSFVDEVFERFLKARTLTERRLVLRDVARHGDNAEMKPEDREALYKLFARPVEEGLLKSDTDKFGHGVLFEEYAHLFPDEAKNPVDIGWFLTHPELKPGDLIVSLGVFELQRVALTSAMTLREQEIESICTEVFYSADAKLVDWMEKTLETRGKQGVFDHCIERVLAHPERNPDLFAWAGRKVIEGNLPHVAESISPIAVCTAAATLLSKAEATVRGDGSEAERREAGQIANRMRPILQEGHARLLKVAVRKTELEPARRFLAHIKMLPGLTNQIRSLMEETVLLEHPSLRRRTKQEEAAEADAVRIHYATADALERKRLELSHILNVELPENSAAIGAARELGDLRENAEYHAAKDRQKILMQRAHELEDLISRARVVDLDNVKPDQVRFGTRVTVRRLAEDAVETILLLGMWEANTEQGIISYLTPFGSQLMGRTAGEQFDVVLPDGRTAVCRVEHIEAASSVANEQA